jgi:hypothetical protein
MEAISMRTVQFTDDGSWGVELTVTGLVSEKQAEAAMQHMQRLFCAEEITEQGKAEDAFNCEQADGMPYGTYGGH